MSDLFGTQHDDPFMSAKKRLHLAGYVALPDLLVTQIIDVLSTLPPDTDLYDGAEMVNDLIGFIESHRSPAP